MRPRTVVLVRRLETRGLLALVLRRGTGRLGGLLLAAAAFGLRLLGALFLLRLGGSLGAASLLFFVRHDSYIPAVGNFVPDFTPTRTFLSPSATSWCACRLFVFVVEQLHVGDVDRCPPCRRCRPAGSSASDFVWRLTIATFSTTTRPCRRTRRTLPRLPLSAPLMTTTSSPYERARITAPPARAR